ncbi:MAG TPA: PIN domain-containing protein [Candidatus Saccharimonadales bacterium]|nr:PIN domain-containing protein [Candidatus Saccharimonadales bacterium]
MKLVFDTSALSQLLSDDDVIVKVFAQQKFGRAIIPIATDTELRFGFAHGSKSVDNLANYELFKKEFDIEVVFPDQETAVIYADLATWARQHGVALSHNDFWIASTCIQIGGSLFAVDQDFKSLPQLRIIEFQAIQS